MNTVTDRTLSELASEDRQLDAEKERLLDTDDFNPLSVNNFTEAIQDISGVFKDKLQTLLNTHPLDHEAIGEAVVRQSYRFWEPIAEEQADKNLRIPGDKPYLEN